MKLDPRIKSLSDILTCFEIERANQFLGEKGYFATALSDFNYLDIIKYGTLTDVRDNDYPFKEGSNDYWAYFIPESILLEEEKFIPFKYLNELTAAGIEVGKVISIKNKNYDIVTLNVLVTEINYNNENNELINITLGATGYEFPTLFNSYLLQVNDEWKPFGVKE